jgi:hypothetical protein
MNPRVDNAMAMLSPHRVEKLGVSDDGDPGMRMNRFGWIAATVLSLGLAACASSSTSPPTAATWVGGDPARLKADLAACDHDADNLDPNQSATYSDPRYGVASAMAAQVGRDNPLMDQKANVRAAFITVCMGDKGWKPG